MPLKNLFAKSRCPKVELITEQAWPLYAKEKFAAPYLLYRYFRLKFHPLFALWKETSPNQYFRRNFLLKGQINLPTSTISMCLKYRLRTNLHKACRPRVKLQAEQTVMSLLCKGHICAGILAIQTFPLKVPSNIYRPLKKNFVSPPNHYFSRNFLLKDRINLPTSTISKCLKCGLRTNLHKARRPRVKLQAEQTCPLYAKDIFALPYLL